jgi:hypothetical protein
VSKSSVGWMAAVAVGAFVLCIVITLYAKMLLGVHLEAEAREEPDIASQATAHRWVTTGIAMGLFCLALGFMGAYAIQTLI